VATSPRRNPQGSHGGGRRALLDASVRVVARKGLRGLTYREVAAEAGVTYGLVSHHFGSRDALIQESLEHAFRESLAVSFLHEPIAGVDEFGRGLPEAVDSLPDHQVFEYEIGLEARRRPEMLAELRAVYDEYVTLVERQLRAIGVDRERTFARLIFATLDGLVLQQLFFGRTEETRQSLEELRTMLRMLAERADDG
jgi:TetR/AcrR family transcriptional regulator, regulator of biofilm formation and stress response